MNSLLVLILTLSIVNLPVALTAPAVAPSEALDCSGSIVVLPPRDMSKSSYWPTTWNENMDAPPIQIDKMCNISISIPRGLYVKLVMKGKMDGDATFILNKGAPYQEMVNSTNLEPRFFVNDQTTLMLMSGMKSNMGTLGLKVNWYHFPSALPDRDYIEAGFAKFLPTSKAPNGLVIIPPCASSQISLVPAPMSSMNLNSLRNTLVFDGPTYYTYFVGSLYDIFMSKKQFVTALYRLTVITFEPMDTMDMFAVQDSENTIGLSEYTAVVCDDMMNCPMILNATAGKSAMISYYKQGETLASAYMAPDATVTVYDGIISTQNVINSYTSTTAKSNLPHTYNQYIKNYVLDKGVAVLNINRKPEGDEIMT